MTVTDGFNRANSAVTLGNADTGQTWAEIDQFGLGGTWGINTNQAYMPSGQAGASIIAAVIPSGYTTGYTVAATLAVVQNYPSAQGFPALVFAADSTTYTTVAWYQVQNDGSGHGVLAALRGFAVAGSVTLGFDIASGDVITVDVYDSPVVTSDYLGKTFRISQNGVLKVTHVARKSTEWGSTTPTTFGQYHGFSAQSLGSNPERVDAFSVSAYSSTNGWHVGEIVMG